uniref:Uncharacterized protein n=1 Tax=Oryza rufipogon TaxID=4529 RepID=A0A0E0QHW0_ORYRU
MLGVDGVRRAGPAGGGRARAGGRRRRIMMTVCGPKEALGLLAAKGLGWSLAWLGHAGKWLSSPDGRVSGEVEGMV